jgi:hypothetical protein
MAEQRCLPGMERAPKRASLSSGGGLPPLDAGTSSRRPTTGIQRRLIESSVRIAADDPETLLYQHTVFCQTGLPYRDPGNAVRVWEQRQGKVALRVEAGVANDPERDEFVELGLPFGPKPRLILAYLNGEALRKGSPTIEVEDSLTAFVRRLRVDTNGRNLRTLKGQLGRLSAATVRLAVSDGERGYQVNAQIIDAFDLWFPKDARQRVLWPSIVELSHRYFESLQRHAVPLDERAVASLAHSAMALDIYAWLAQRLHRVDPRKPQFISWPGLKAQFGWHYGRMDKFKAVFRKTLAMVQTQYPKARLELDQRGITLRNSHPPVSGRRLLLVKHT